MNQNTPHNLLPVCPAFDGRDSDLAQLLDQVTTQKVCQLTGDAGIGKTELARAIGHQARQSDVFPDGVFRIAMDDTSRPATLLGELVLLLGFDETHGLQTTMGNTRALIIWDQLDTMIADQPQRITEFLNNTMADIPGVHHLLVSRNGLPDMDSHRLEALDTDTCRAIFAANLPETVSASPAADDADFATALTLLGGNPLAVTTAAAWCRPPNWTHDLVNVLQKQEGDSPLAHILGAACSDLGDEPMRLLALLHAFPTGADGDSILATFGEEWQEPLAQVQRVGLLPEGQRHLLHPSVRDFIATRLGKIRADAFREQAAVFLHQLIRECRNQVEAGNIGPALKFLTHEWPNLRAAFSWVTNRMEGAGVDLEEDCELILDYCFVLFHLFTNKRMFSEGLSWMEAGREAAEEAGSPHELALMHDYCGVLNVYLGNDAAGKDYLTRAIDTFRELNEAAGIASTGYHLGLLAYRAGELDAAQEYFEEALPIMRRGDSRAFAAQTTTFLGQIYLAQGNLQSAYDTLTEAINLYQEQTISLDLRLNTLFGLSRAALMTGNPEESLERVTEAISVAFSISPRTATTTLPNILQMAEVYLSYEGGQHFAAFSTSMTQLVIRLQGVTPKPEVAKEWTMTCHLMDRLARLLGHMEPASTSADSYDAVRPAVITAAKELDGLSGGIMKIEQWINAWLDGAAQVN